MIPFRSSSSSLLGEDLARAGVAPTPPWPLHGPTHYFAGAAASLADVQVDVAISRPSVREDKQQNAPAPTLSPVARTPNLQHRIDELVIALALVDAENNVLRRQLAAMARNRDTWRAEVMAG